MKTIPYQIKATKPELRRDGQLVPYTIIQTMKVNEVPNTMYNAAMSWVQMNPEYDYEFFDDKRCVEFLKKHYPPTVLHCFNMMYMGAARADLFRWAYLNIKGGVYLDIDMICKVPIRKYIFDTDKYVTRLVGGFNIRYRLNHNFIATIPGFILLTKSIDNAINNTLIRYKQKKDEYLPQDICGPGVIGRTLNILMGRPKNSSHLEHKNNIARVGENKIRLLTQREIDRYLIRKYRGYLDDCKKNGFKRYSKGEPAFKFSFAEKYVNDNNAELDFNLIKGKFI